MAKAPTAKRYAQALFQLAEEHNKAEVWLEELNEAGKMVQDPTVYRYLTWPQVLPAKKLAAIRELFQDSDPMILNAIGLLTIRQSVGFLPAIASEFSQLLNASRGRVKAESTSAVKLSEVQVDRLRKLLGEMLGKEVVLDVREDADILGGIIVKVGDQLIDGSVRTRLRSLGQKLSQQPIV